MTAIKAWAALQEKAALEPFEYKPGPLGSEEVEVTVEYCGVCHSDLSMIENEWNWSQYPLVPGHEVVGRITAVGSGAKGRAVGDLVGIGWTAGTCMHCRSCLAGDQHLCAESVPTIIGHYGGFAERVRAHWAWTIPLLPGIDPASAGPLFCGGITVFTPLAAFGLPPTARVGVVGIGGLGHLALRFAAAWGCEVTAFTSSASKHDEARGFGAHHVVSSRDSADIEKLAGKLDLLLITANVTLDWPALMKTLAPKGRLHVVGVVLEPIPIAAFDIIAGQRTVAGSPSGAPATIAAMLEFAARHGIAPQVEHFPMREANAALEHLRAGKARYRIVLDADFKS